MQKRRLDEAYRFMEESRSKARGVHRKSDVRTGLDDGVGLDAEVHVDMSGSVHPELQ